MRKTVTAILSLGVALAPLSVSANEDDKDLEERIAALEEMIAELKTELAAEKTEPKVEVIRVSATSGTTMEKKAEAKVADGFRMGDTIVKVGGFIDMDAHVTNVSSGTISSGSIGRDFYIPSVTPTGDGDDTTFTDFTAEGTRLFVKASRDGAVPVSGYVEMDFLGSLQGNERVSNSFSPRLRRAYLDVSKWRVGQEWTTFQNTSAIPESASFLVLSDGMVFIRQPQIRYTSGNFQIALENGDTTVTPAGGGRLEADTNVIPDVVVRHNLKGDFGNVSVAALGRQLRSEMGGIDDETYGFGASVSGRLKVGMRDDIRFNLVGGEGVGRYVGLNSVNGAAEDPVTGDLEAIPSYGGLIAYRHPFGETARLNVGYSGLWADNPDFIAGSATASTQSGYAAVLWDIAPKTTFGVEGMFGTRETEDGETGDISRVTVSTKFAF